MKGIWKQGRDKGREKGKWEQGIRGDGRGHWRGIVKGTQEQGRDMRRGKGYKERYIRGGKGT